MRSGPSDLFDSDLLAAGNLPADLPLHRGPVIVLWQPPSAQTLATIARKRPGIPIIAGRFEAETPLHQARLPYWIAADFFPVRAMLDIDIALQEARRTWRGPSEPTYLGMSLVDGDYARLYRVLELTVLAGVLLKLRESNPRLRVIGDWVVTRLAQAAGLITSRLWRSDLADLNWPPRRWCRERFRDEHGRLRLTGRSGAHSGNLREESCEQADVVFLMAGWVERRFMESFPIQAIASRGYECSIWATGRSDALDELIKVPRVRHEPLEYPSSARDAGDVERSVARWCEHAVRDGYFAPLRGRLAASVARLLNWPRWAGKLLAMHRLLTARLEQARPRLLVAPAEKDWATYCGHHAARQLNILSVGCRHGAWPAGTHASRWDHRYYFPPAPRHVAAFTPGDVELSRSAQGVTADTIAWHGNPRLDKPTMPAPPTLADGSVRILIGAQGPGASSPLALRRRIHALNQELIETLHRRLADRLWVRAHPWDAASDYPVHLQPLFRPLDESMETQLAQCGAVVTSYSTIAMDAGAAGRPVFLWDYAQLGYERTELAQQGGLIVVAGLADLCEKVERFAMATDERCEFQQRAGRFPAYLRAQLPVRSDSLERAGNGDLTSSLADWLCERAGPPR